MSTIIWVLIQKVNSTITIGGQVLKNGALAVGVILILVIIRYVVFPRWVNNIDRDKAVFKQLRLSINILLFISGILSIGYIFGVAIVEPLFSIGITSAVVGVIITAVGGAVLSGLMLLQSRSYETGDVIEIPGIGIRGIVEQVSLLNTSLRLPDDSYIVLSNRTVRKMNIINRTLGEDNIHRTSVEILITYESNVADAQKHLSEVARTVDGIQTGGQVSVGQWDMAVDPTPQIDALADHGILIKLRYWVKEPCNTSAIRSELLQKIEMKLHDTDIEFAYPHNHVVFDETSGEIRVDTSK